MGPLLMFTKLFQKQYTSQPIKGKTIWTISADETTIVMWNQSDNNIEITTFDKYTTWQNKSQIINTNFESNDKLRLNETGTILAHQNNQKISTWCRYQKKGKWVYKTCTYYKSQQIYGQNSAFYNNFLFIAQGEFFKIILRSQNFKLIRRQRAHYSDYFDCMCFSYKLKLLYQVSDGVIYIWGRDKGPEWDKLRTVWIVLMPFYSSCQENELKAFSLGYLQIINCETRKIEMIQDDRIQQTRTQSALNYFFQNRKNSQICFWSRESPAQKGFNYEILEVKAQDILLGLNGRVFAVQKNFEDGFVIELYESK